MTTRLKGNMADIAKMVDELSSFTVMEVADLVKQLEAKWGVTAAAPVMAAPAGGAAAGGGDFPAGAGPNQIDPIVAFFPPRKKNAVGSGVLALKNVPGPAGTQG